MLSNSWFFDYINNSIFKLSFSFPVNSFSILLYFTIVSEARGVKWNFECNFFENLKIEQISNSELLNIFKKSGKYKCRVSKLVIVINLLSSYSPNDLFIFANVENASWYCLDLIAEFQPFNRNGKCLF